jgi:hypothetical protein
MGPLRSWWTTASMQRYKTLKEEIMKHRKLLTSAICIISVFVLIGTAQAFNWYGFSELCYEADLKGSPNQEIQIEIVNLTIQGGCQNIQDAQQEPDCQNGIGHTGNMVIDAFSETSVDSDKVKNTVHISGCIDLSPFCNHDLPACTDPQDALEGGECHVHICHPYDNVNLVEIPGSCYVPSLDVIYSVINTKNNKPKYKAHQTCYWPGTIDQETCLPIHDGEGPNGEVYFECTEEEIIE